MLRNMKNVECPPPTNLKRYVISYQDSSVDAIVTYFKNNQTTTGIMAWCTTWRVVIWLYLCLTTMKNVSMKSVNLEKKYHQTVAAINKPSC